MMSSIAEILWPIVIGLLFLWLRKPLYRLLDAFAKSVTRIRTISTPWGNLTFEEVETQLNEREKLRAAAEVALTGKELKHDELSALQYLVQGITPSKADIRESIGLELLHSTFNIAMGDNILQDQERESLIQLAIRYGWSKEEATRIIGCLETKYRNRKKPKKSLGSDVD